MIPQWIHRFWLISLLYVSAKSYDLDRPGLKGSVSRRLQESVTAEVYIKFDDFPPETGWSIVNADTQEAVVNYTVGTYPLGQPDHTESVTLTAGQSYIFTILDGAGDGMSNPITGFFYLKQGGFILVEADGDFGESQSIPFLAVAERETPTTAPVSSTTPAPVAVTEPTTGSFSPTNSMPVNITVEITFDLFPFENGWSIIDPATNETIVNVPIGTYEFGLDNLTQLVEVSTGHEYVLTIVDRFGDGLCCIEPGSFMILQDEVVLVDRINGTSIGQSLSVRFTPFYPLSASTSPTSSPTASSTETEPPTTGPVSSTTPTPVAVTEPTTGSFSPTNSMLVNITVEITFDLFPFENGWSIIDPATNETIVNVPIGTYEFGLDNLTQLVEVSTGHEYVLTIVDRFGDGLCCIEPGSFMILQDEVVLVDRINGTSIGQSLSVRFTPFYPPSASTSPTSSPTASSTETEPPTTAPVG